MTKLIPAPVDLGKLSDAVKNNIVKRADKLATKVNNINTSGFVLKTDASELLKKTNYNKKNTEIENKIPILSSLATNAGITAVENKISDVSSLVKTDYNAKVTDIENKLTDHEKYIMRNTLLLQSLTNKLQKILPQD